MAKGITGTGQGFDLPGRRLGGFSRQPPFSSLRQTALEAAEKRRRVGVLLPPGPKRLGGDINIMAALSPIQAAAMAAERRMQDEIWCGSVSCGSAVGSDSGILGQPGFVGSSKDSTVSKTDTSEVIILDDESGFGDSYKSKISYDSLLVQSLKDGSKSNSKDGSTSASTLNAMLDHSAQNNTMDKVTWECSTCTLLNQVKLFPLFKIAHRLLCYGRRSDITIIGWLYKNVKMASFFFVVLLLINPKHSEIPFCTLKSEMPSSAASFFFFFFSKRGKTMLLRCSAW